MYAYPKYSLDCVKKKSAKIMDFTKGRFWRSESEKIDVNSIESRKSSVVKEGYY